MTWYTAGTVSVTNGSAAVTGAGTDFVANVAAGDIFSVPGVSSIYEVASIQSATQLTLARTWLGTTAGGQGYGIAPTQSFTRDLAIAASALLNSFGAVRDGIGAGLIADGTLAAPGIRFAADPDSGLRRVDTNALALVTGGVDRLTIDATGNLLVGSASGNEHRIRKTVANNAGAVVLNVMGDGAISASFSGISGGLGSAANAALKVATDAITGRSINAGGTINASGADYAEYMTKAPGCGAIAAGDVCGVDREGNLTRSWAEAVRYVVKSTDPTIVGGDTWAAHLDPRPEAPAAIAPEPTRDDGEDDARFGARLSAWRRERAAYGGALAGYQASRAAWDDELERCRRTVDRIAFCGQVPVNVPAEVLAACGAALDDGEAVYLVAVANGGGIAAAAVREAEMTLPRYMRRLGPVWAIRDGRPIIDVQHG